MKINKDAIIEGLIIPVFKPINWTSFDVVKKIRSDFKKLFDLKKIKVGHAGTLDPLATGLLLICTGKKTKEIEKLQNLDKTYYATFCIGKTTPSFDRETEFDKNYPTDHINNKLINESMSSFIGEIRQQPPIYSALKVKGKRLYDMARKGENIKINYRKIKIYDFNLISNTFPELDFKIVCSKGTYIRSLAYDFGKKLNSGAYLKYLERFSIGDYNIKNSITVDQINKLLFE